MARTLPEGLKSRTTVVVSLLAVAVLAPSGAWWFSGSSQAENRTRAAVREVRLAVQSRTDESARRLAYRLDGLRSREDERPFYHYQNLFHDPRGAAEGLSVMLSPLADGSADPLIDAHFQIAADGRISLPTVNDDFPELSTEEGFTAYCSFLADLEEASLSSRTAAVPGQGGDQTLFLGAGEFRLPPQPDDRVVVLAASQWEQIDEANAVYARLAGHPTTEAPRPIRRGYASEEQVEVRIGRFRWTTLLVPKGPMLAALRQVSTPSGIHVQGFSVDLDAVSRAAGFPPTSDLSPDGQAQDHTVRSAIGDTGWVLTDNAAAELSSARSAAEAARGEATRTFALVFSAAAIAALSAILLVHQADALANQRMRFAAAAAHELKTPLTTLKLYSEMLADDIGDEGRRRSYAKKLAAETGRLGRVVTNILDLSRLERGGLLVEVHQGDIRAVIEQCLEGLTPTLAGHGLPVSWRRPEAAIDAVFDPDAVCQILANLLDNAERYTRGVEGRKVRVSLTTEDRLAILKVADNGPGIDHGTRRHLFRAFDRESSRAGPVGLGLGLALARSLARAQDGDLVLADRDGARGATFELRLPTVQ